MSPRRHSRAALGALLALTGVTLLAGCNGPLGVCEGSCGDETSGAAGGGGGAGGDSGGETGGAGAGSMGGGAGSGGTGGHAGGSGGGSGGNETGGGGSAGGDGCAAPWSGALQMGSELDDQALALIADPQGGLYVAGFERGLTGVTNIEPDGDSVAFVRRISPEGQIEWTQEIDTAATDTVEALAYDPAHDEILVAGRTSGAWPGSVNQGQFDAFFAVLGQDGGERAFHQMGRERPEHPRAVAVASEDHVLVAGHDDIFIPSNYVESWEDGFIVEMSLDRMEPYAAVDQAWLRSNTPGSDMITALAVDPAEGGAFYVGGYSSGGPGGGVFVKKMGPDGSTAWTRLISKLTLDTVGAIGLSPGGDLIVTGATFSTLGAQSYGQQDVYVMKLDRGTGAVIWAAQHGSPESDLPTGLAFDAGGDIIVAGVSPGSLVEGYAVQGGEDLFALKLDPEGALLSAWQGGTSEDDKAASVAVDVCGTVFIAGHTQGSLAEGQVNAGGQDLFIMTAPL